MRRWALVARGVPAAVLAFAIAPSGAALAAPVGSLPDGRLTIATMGPPSESINQSIPFNAASQEFVASAAGTIDGLDVTFTGMGDPDPSLSYQLTIENSTAATRDVFLLFRIPIVSVSEPGTVTASLDVDLVNRNGGAIFARVVEDRNGIQESKGIVEASPGVPIAVDLGVPLATEDITTAGLSRFEDGPAAPPDPDPFGAPYSGLEIRSNLELSAGDAATLTGTVVMTVPEPGALAALGGPLVLLVALARRRAARRTEGLRGNG